MPKFEKQYVHFMWDDELQGKKCFVSSYIDLLEEFVTNNKTEQCHKIEKSDRPKHGFTFYAKGDYFAFAYYDPYYDLKVAHEQGKTIQYLVGEEWDDVPEPIWNDEPKRYRIKPDDPNRIVTNRELARMNKYTFYYYTSQEDYINGMNMRNFEIHSKSFQQAFGAYVDFFRNLDSYKVSNGNYYCNSSLRSIPEKYIHLVNTHFF